MPAVYRWSYPTVYGTTFQATVSSWRQHCQLAERIHLRTLDAERTAHELVTQHQLSQYDAEQCVRQVRAWWAARGAEQASDKRDAIRARLNYMWELSMQRPVKDLKGQAIIVDGEPILDPDLPTARNILKDLRTLDALDMPLRVQIDANLSVTTTTVRERVMGLLARARAQALPQPAHAGGPLDAEPDEHRTNGHSNGHSRVAQILGVDVDGNSVIDVPEGE